MNQIPIMQSQEAILSNIQQMAEQSSDPMKRMLAQMALTRMQENKTPAPERPVQNMSTRSSKMLRDIQLLIQMNQDLIGKLKQYQLEQQRLDERNQVVAAALGACNCWGLEADCPHCQGQGIAGTQEVNTTYFQDLVLPFFQKLNAFNAHAADADPSQ